MRPVNLIPPEDRRGDHAPLRAGVASYVIVGVLALALDRRRPGGPHRQRRSRTARPSSPRSRRGRRRPTWRAPELAPTRASPTLEEARDDDRHQPRAEPLRLGAGAERARARDPATRDAREPHRDAQPPAPPSAATRRGTLRHGRLDHRSLAGDRAAAREGQKGVARFLAALKDIDGVTRVGMQSSELGEEDVRGAGRAGDSAPRRRDADRLPDQADDRQVPDHGRLRRRPGPPRPSRRHRRRPRPRGAPATAATDAGDDRRRATTDGGVAETQSRAADAVDSATQQVSEAKSGAAAVGVGGG